MSSIATSSNTGISDIKRETTVRPSSSTPTSTQVSPGDRTANKPEEQHHADRNPEYSFVQSPNSRRDSQDYFARYPATPQYDHLFLDSEPISPYFRASPKSPGVTSTLRSLGPSSKFHFPPPKSTSLPAPKFGMSSSYDNQDGEDDTKAAAAVLAATANDEDAKKSSPPRERNKVSVVSPPEGENIRKSNPNADAPYSPHTYSYPPNGPYYHQPSKVYTADEVPSHHYPYPHPYYTHPYGPLHGYYRPEEGRHESQSPSRRPNEEPGDVADGHPPPHYRYGQHPYYDRYYYAYYHPSVSESFDTDERTGHQSEPGMKRAPRSPSHIPKSNSFPPPPSPPRYGHAGEGDASASSYPGLRRVHHSPERSMAHPFYGYPPEGARYYGQIKQSDSPSSDPHKYYVDNPSVHYGPPPGYYTSSHEYVRENERRFGTHPPKFEDEKACGSIDSGNTSPAKNSASSHAQAAIAAGMTEPASAKEVDFDICNPPLEPIVPPSSEPLFMSNTQINLSDVLCGRGGGTNTQVGNRRFRTLVQEFQPTYLLCRRKEKPLIARTIVLIIRKRGGRFLKKNEEDNGFYEVGDEKAEAKTSQALREGLDVRASKVNLDGKKKSRGSKKKKSEKDIDSPDEGRQMPSYPDAYGYAPPYHYPYGGDPYYGTPPVPYGYPPPPAHLSPSRKRARHAPAHDDGYDPRYTSSPYKPPYPYSSYPVPPPPQEYYGNLPGQDEAGREDENPMWEMDFSPPRTSIPREHAEH